MKTILEMVIEKNERPTMNVEDLLRGALKHIRVQLPDVVQKVRLPASKETPVSSLPKSAATLSRLAELAKRMGQEAGVETEVREKEAEKPGGERKPRALITFMGERKISRSVSEGPSAGRRIESVRPPVYSAEDPNKAYRPNVLCPSRGLWDSKETRRPFTKQNQQHGDLRRVC